MLRIVDFFIIHRLFTINTFNNEKTRFSRRNSVGKYSLVCSSRY